MTESSPERVTNPAPGSAVNPSSDDFDDEADSQQPANQADGDDGDDDDDLGDAGKRALARMKNERAQARRELTQARSQIAELTRANQSESERAVTDAETRGREAARAEFGPQLARARFDVLAARRNADADTDAILEFVDMARFIGDDGEINETALQSAVTRLVPEAGPAGPPDQDGGPRRPTQIVTMNDIIRGQAGQNRSA